MKKWEKAVVVFMLIISFVLPSVLSIPVVPVQAATIKLNKKSITLTVGKTELLKVTGTKATPTWQSNNKKIVTVSSKGQVKAISIGSAIISATIKKTKLTCTVKVNKIKDSDNTTQGGKTSLFTLNEKGFFAKPFCKTIDLKGSAEYSPIVMLFYVNLKDETKKTADSLKKTSDVFESASLTFYHNGKVKIVYKLTDKLYKTFSERELWPTIVPQQKEEELDYKVDLAKREITLSDGSKYLINMEKESIIREYILTKEVFSLNGKVEGSSTADEKVINYTVLKDLSYDSDLSDERSKMDVYVPNYLDESKNNGAIILIYGGGWTGGSKEDSRVFGEQYASEGYVSVAVNMHNAFYNETTKKTDVTVFDMLNDIHASVKKLKELSDKNGWNITQCATQGVSSGANLALTYAYSRGTDVPYFNTEEVIPVKFAIDIVGPVDMHDSAWNADLDWTDRNVTTGPGAGPAYASHLTGSANNPNMTEEVKESYLNAMSPVYYVEKYGAVPTVMGYSIKDFIQSPNNGKRLKGYLDKKSIRNDLFTFPNSIHSFNNDPEEAKLFFDKTIEYAETYFK